MNKLIPSLALAFLFGTAAHAQNLSILKYSVGLPMGDLQEHIGRESWRGVGAGYRYFADGNVAVGVDMGFQMFFEKKDYDTYTYGTASLSGTQYRYSWNTSITGELEYVLNEGDDFRPFLGMGIGTVYTKRVTDFGLYRFTQDPWQFLMKPEVGITYYLSDGRALLLSAEYFAAFDTKELEGQPYLTLNIGFVFSGD